MELLEYKILKKINKITLPYFLKVIIFYFLLILAIPQILLPIFPWSFFVWLIMFLIWIILISPIEKIKHIIKIRKWLTYLVKNIFNKQIWRYKIKDFKKHYKKIFK